MSRFCPTGRDWLNSLMWSTATAPSLAEIEAMAHDMLERLPDGFSQAVRGRDRSRRRFSHRGGSRRDAGRKANSTCLACSRVIGLPQQSHDDVARLPNMIWLYRRPILDYWAEHDETLGHIVRHVLIHEIGHHFGLSDADMAAIEANSAE